MGGTSVEYHQSIHDGNYLYQTSSDSTTFVGNNRGNSPAGGSGVSNVRDYAGECELNDFGDYENRAKELCRNAGIENDGVVEEGFSDKVQSSFKNFFDSLSSFGMAKDSSAPPSAAAGMVNILGGLVPVAGMGVGTMLAFSLNTLCARLASAFRSSSEEVARTIFSGFCIASTTIRAALPIAAEMARAAKKPEEILVCSVATAVMASVYLATSSIAALLAGHHAILNSPTTSAMARKVNEETECLKEVDDNFSQLAQESLKKIGQMLAEWKTNVSANFLSFAREILLFSGAAISALSALSRFAPVLAVPFVSIITGSISLVANVVEMAQGVVEYRNQKAKLEALKSIGNPNPKTQEEIKKLENQMKVSAVRIAKGGLNVLLSIASIVFGVLTVVTSFSMPIVPAVLTAVSLTSVLVLGVVGLVVRKMNNASAVASAQEASIASSEEMDAEQTDDTESGESETSVPTTTNPRPAPQFA